MVFTSYAASGAFHQPRTGDSGDAISAATPEGDRRAHQVSNFGTCFEIILAEHPRGSYDSLRGCGNLHIKGGDKNLPSVGDHNGTVQERPGCYPNQLESIQELLGPILPGHDPDVGNPHFCLRGRRKEFPCQTSRSMPETRRRESEDQNPPRQSNWDREAGDGSGGRCRRTTDGSHVSKSQENARCYEHGYDYTDGERGGCLHFTKAKRIEGPGIGCKPSSSTEGAFSLGCTTSLPYLGRWAQPATIFNCTKKVRWEDEDVPCFLSLPQMDDDRDPNLRWEQMKPQWAHSIQFAADFKSPLEAMRQGFLMEQTFLDVAYSDELQRFELCPGLQSTIDDTPAKGTTLEAANTQFRANFCPEQSGDLRCNLDTMELDAEQQHDRQMAAEDTEHPMDFNYMEDDHATLQMPHDVDLVPIEDLDTLCAELTFDLDDLRDLGIAATRPDSHLFYIYAATSIGVQPAVLELESPWHECSNAKFWHALVHQIVKAPHHQAFRVLRAFGSVAERLAGVHHVIIVPWRANETPSLLQRISPEGIETWIFDAMKFDKMRDLKQIDAVLSSQMSCYKFWQAGRNLAPDDCIVQQCGTNITATFTLYEPNKARFAEEDVAESPRFEIGMDEDIVLPEDVQGRDDALVVIRDDENLVLQTITALQAEDTIHLILFGFDGEGLGRRDVDASPVSFEGVQRAIERCWQDFQGHLVKPYLVQPQPEALAREGLVFVVAIQHVFANAPVPRQGCILGLAGMQLTYVGSTAPDIHRPIELDERFCEADVKASLQITRLCKPFGRRHCDVFSGSTLMEDGAHYDGFPGTYIKVDIQDERIDFDIRRACREYDSIIQDLTVAQQDSNLHQIQLVQHGHRFRSIGRVNQYWDRTVPLDEISLAAQHFAQGWIAQPLDRMQIFRVRALDAVDSHVGTLMLHFVVAFDLIPGHSVCVAFADPTMPAWTISGPHLLQPQFWDRDGLDVSIPNPIRNSNYEILLFPGRQPTLTAQSGDAIMYTEGAHRIEDEEEEQETEESSLLQHRFGQDCLPGRDFAVAHPRVKPCPAYELPGPPQRPGRVIELFPLLWGSCDEVPLPQSEVECERFLQACKQFPLRQDIPASFQPYILPITWAYLETCADDLGIESEYHIYTDGSSFLDKSDGHAERDGTWSAVVFQVKGSQRRFVGWTAGYVIVDEYNKRFIGATDKRALQAERSGIFWIMAWTLGLPPGRTVNLYVDNQAACFGANGQWTYAMTDGLALRTRALVLLVSERHNLKAHHVKSHTQQPERVCRCYHSRSCRRL